MNSSSPEAARDYGVDYHIPKHWDQTFNFSIFTSANALGGSYRMNTHSPAAVAHTRFH